MLAPESRPEVVGGARTTLRRILASWWILLTAAPLGWLSWAAFLYVGRRARRRRWFLWAGVYFAVVWGCMVAQELLGRGETTTASTVVWLLVFAAWGASFVHAVAIRSVYLERRAVLGDPRLARAERRQDEREMALELVRTDPARARDVGVGRPDLPDAFHGGLVDVNRASAGVLADLPGFDRALAERTVEVREEIGGFESLDDLEGFLDLTIDDVDRLRGRAICLPF